jgi:3-oxoacyl-[acyl-carrier-protein] synthase II
VPRGDPMLRVAITGLGAVAATGIDLAELGAALRWGLPLHAAAPPVLTAHLEEAELQAFDRASQLAVVAARLAFADAGEPRHDPGSLGVSFGNTYGCLGAQVELDRMVLTDGPRAMRGSLFPYGVFNAPAANVAIALHARGPNLTQATGEAAGTDACAAAARQIECGDADAMLVGGVETIPAELSVWRDALGGPRVSPAEGAAVLMLESGEIAARRGAKIHGHIVGASSRLAGEATRESRARAAVASARSALAEACVTPAELRFVVGDLACLEELFDGLPPPSLTPRVVLGDLLSAAGTFQLLAALLAPPRGTGPGAILSLSLSQHGIATSLVLTS